jgi:hypothetical protein
MNFELAFHKFHNVHTHDIRSVAHNIRSVAHKTFEKISLIYAAVYIFYSNLREG